MFTLDFFGWTKEDYEDYINRIYAASIKEKDATTALNKENKEKEYV